MLLINMNLSRRQMRRLATRSPVLPRIAIALAGFALLAGCGKTDAPQGLIVAATTTMVADLAAAVAGDHAEVKGLMGPGVDPHLYKATAGDVNTLQSANLILYSGLHLEGRMTEVLVRLGRRGTPVYAVTEGIPESELLEPEEFAGHYDPHVWFDPSLWSYCVDTVVEALSSVEPSHADYFEKRGASVKSDLQALKNWAEAYVNELPEEKRILVTSHDAYNYFGRAFDFQVVGVQGISTMSEAGLADIVKVIEFIQERQIKAIFIESSVSPATIQRISKDSGAKIGGELFSDAMGEKGHREASPDGRSYDVGTYEGMFKHNLVTIVEALR